MEYTFDKEVEDEELGQMRSQIERQAKVFFTFFFALR